MIIKHKILKELYHVSLFDKSNNITLVDVSLNLDILRKRINTNEQDFHSALEVLNINKEIFVSWEENMAAITRDGIVSLGNKKYYYEHKKRSREKVFFYIKIVSVIATVLTIIISFIKIVEHFTSQPK
jgi:hypothetical protein